MRKIIVNPDGTAVIIEYEKNNDQKILKKLSSECTNCSNNPINGGSGNYTIVIPKSYKEEEE